MLVKIQCKTGPKIVDLNRRRAIREKCLDCSAWAHKEVLNCEFPDCPLYPFRSGKGKQDSKLRAKAIRDFCLWCTDNQPAEVIKCTANSNWQRATGVSPGEATTCSLYPYRKSRIDRSVQIDSAQKKQHIHGYIETNSVE